MVAAYYFLAIGFVFGAAVLIAATHQSDHGRAWREHLRRQKARRRIDFQ